MKDPLESVLMAAMPDSQVAESFRVLRTNMLRWAHDGIFSFVFLSAWASEGKSLVTMNLAVALAQVDKRIVLIDGDMRRPKLSALFGIEEKPGFSNVLQDANSDAKEFLLPTSLARLQLISCGEVNAIPPDILTQEAIGRVIGQLKGSCDLLLIDSPPLMSFADAVLLSSVADGVVWVVNPKRWRGDDEIKMKKNLEASGARLLGLVMNEVESQEQSPYDEYRYRYRVAQNRK